MRVGWLDSPTFDHHLTGGGHPERPARLRAVREAIAKRGLESRVLREEAPVVERALLGRVHDDEYIEYIERVAAAGGGRVDADTAVSGGSWEAALRAAGGVALAVEWVLDGVWDRAFCSVRPPGHHAPRDRAMGFCLFDNVAVGAAAALERGLERVAILDWDVHHGNGTQDIFWESAQVMYLSSHQYPLYPGTGAADERGAGAGLGTTVNVPLAAGSGDGDLLRGWREIMRPALEGFGPELLLISAGFDADARDPLGGLEVTPKGFAELSREVVLWAEQACKGRVVSVLEGGYDLDALGEDVCVHLEVLCG